MPLLAVVFVQVTTVVITVDMFGKNTRTKINCPFRK